MISKLVQSGSLLMFVCLATACSPQSTPSMMNVNKPVLTSETVMQQLAVKDIKDGHLRMIADDYARYGSGSLHLSLVYDPKSPSYTAMKAFNDLSSYKDRLGKLGIKNVDAETVQAAGDPMLMITYDAVKAQAPAGCNLLPGTDTNQTTRFIGDYKFGCTTDTMLARQIYRPEDLKGNSHLDAGDGRRAANSTEHYRVVTEDEASGPLDVLTRDQISAQ